MRALFLFVLGLLGIPAEAAGPRFPPAAKPPVREYFNNPGFHDPVASGVPVSLDSASEPLDVTIYWNAAKQPDRAISSENP